MLNSARVITGLPAQDLPRAKAFYREKLGLEPSDGDADNAFYRFADGTEFNLFRSTGSPSGTHTQMAFVVKDVTREVQDLKSKGVRFEEYDFPGLKTVDGVAEVGGTKTAWFKDSEGNLLNIVQPVRVIAGQRR